MASLDKIEGETIESILLVAMVALVAFGLWFYFHMSGANPAEWARKFGAWLQQMIGKLPRPGSAFDRYSSDPGGARAALDNLNATGGTDYNGDGAQVHTGTSNDVPVDYVDAINSGGSE